MASSLGDFANSLRENSSSPTPSDNSNKKMKQHKKKSSKKHIEHDIQKINTSSSNSNQNNLKPNSPINHTSVQSQGSHRPFTPKSEISDENAHIVFAYMPGVNKFKTKSKPSLSQAEEETKKKLILKFSKTKDDQIQENNELKNLYSAEPQKNLKKNENISKKDKIKKLKLEKKFIEKRNQKLEKEYPKFASPVSSTLHHNNRSDSPLVENTSWTSSSVYSAETDVLSPVVSISDFFSYLPETSNSIHENSLWVNTHRIRNYLTSSSSIDDDSSSKIQSPKTPTSPNPSHNQSTNYHQYLTKKRRSQRSQTWSGSMPIPSTLNQVGSPPLHSSPIATQSSKKLNQSPNSSQTPQIPLSPRSIKNNSVHQLSRNNSKILVTSNSNNKYNENEEIYSLNSDIKENENTHQISELISKWTGIHSSPNSIRKRSQSIHSNPLRVVDEEVFSDTLSSVNEEYFEHFSPPLSSLTQSPLHIDTSNSQSLINSNHLESFHHLNDIDEKIEPNEILYESDQDSLDFIELESAPSQYILQEVPVDTFEVQWSEIHHTPESISLNKNIEFNPNRLSPTNRFDRRLSDPPSFFKSPHFKLSEEIKNRSRSSSFSSILSRSSSLKFENDNSILKELSNQDLTLIFSFVPYIKRFSLYSICRKWYKVLNAEQSILWKDINMNKLSEDTKVKSKLLYFIFHRFGKYVNFLKGSFDITSCIEIIAEESRELRELDINITHEFDQNKYNYIKHLRQILKQNLHLKRLKIHQYKPYIGHETISEFISTCRILRDLEIVQEFEKEEDNNSNSDIEDKEVEDDDSRITIETIKTIASKGFKLQFLTLVDCPIDNDTITFIIKNCRILNTFNLTIKHLKGITIDPIHFFSQPHILKLKLSLPQSIDYITLIKSLPNRIRQHISHIHIDQEIDERLKNVFNNDLTFDSNGASHVLNNVAIHTNDKVLTHEDDIDIKSQNLSNGYDVLNHSIRYNTEDKEKQSDLTNFITNLLPIIYKFHPKLESFFVRSPFVFLSETDIEYINKYFKGVDINLMNKNEELIEVTQKSKSNRPKKSLSKTKSNGIITKRPEWKR